MPQDMDEVYSKFQPDAELIWTLKKNWRGLELNGSPVETDAFGLRATTNSRRPARGR